MKQTRKTFLKVLGASSLAVAINPLKAGVNLRTPAVSNLILGLASYTLRTLNLDETLAAATRLNLEYIAFKSMHMPLESTEAEIKAILAKVKESGRKLYGAGVIYMKTEEEVDNAFRYAKTAGLSMIIGVPNPELLKRAEQRVKETNIKLAIHNHGPEDKMYPSPKAVFDNIANLDKRIGFCVDVGHTLRSGYDPAQVIRQYNDRIYDLHLKDIESSKPDAGTLEMGRGVIDIPSIIGALKSIRYSGVMAVEYEKDGDDPLPGLAESIGYARGIMKMS